MNRRALRWGLGLVAAVGLGLALRDRLDIAALGDWVTAAGGAGPLVFMALYVLGTVLFLPGSVVTLAGGALFGPLWGLTGATGGAALAFLIARWLGRAPGRGRIPTTGGGGGGGGLALCRLGAPGAAVSV